MKMCWFIIAAVVIGASSLTEAVACSSSWGLSAKDKDYAKAICDTYKSAGLTDVQAIAVNESIITADVTRTFYRVLVQDKLTGNKFVRVYVDKMKVVEGDTTWTGEDRVKFLIE
jgi:hypothetical protein